MLPLVPPITVAVAAVPAEVSAAPASLIQLGLLSENSGKLAAPAV